MRFFCLIFFACMGLAAMLCPAGLLLAGENPPEGSRLHMDEMVVTATRQDDIIAGLPKSVSVITAQDIALAPETSLSGLLAREVGVVASSFYGHDRFAGVDIRGMGDSSASTVLVLVDGFRINPPDLAGPDFSAIAIDSIERIEILRGAGSVLYGDGAVGGVVNIITKKAPQKTSGSVGASVGSYNSYGLKAQAGGRAAGLGIGANASLKETDGFRDNSFLKAKNASIKLDYSLFERMNLVAGTSFNEDEYGLPGPLGIEDAKSGSLRRSTQYPDDAGKTSEKRARLGFDLDLGQWGNLIALRDWRWRENSFVLGYTPLLPRDRQTDAIDEASNNLDLRWSLTKEVFGRENRLVLGGERFFTDYVREQQSSASRQNSQITAWGLFAHNRFKISDTLALSAGFRHAINEITTRTDNLVPFGASRVWVGGPVEEKSVSHNVYEAGLTWDIANNAMLFGSFSTSFRNPNVDELAQAAGQLVPQTGKHFEVGGRYRAGLSAEFSASLFYTVIENEIYYGLDPNTLLAVNRNYFQDTVRQGLELGARAYPTEKLFVWANYSFVDAHFEGSGRPIPLVAAHKADAGIEWQALSQLVAALSGSFVGERRDGNDTQDFSHPRLDSYFSLNAKLVYDFYGARLSAGVLNALDSHFMTTAYSGRGYPMPGRNFYGSVEFDF
jgi:outer membrane receptor protein involved in Fe transport